MRIPSKLKIVPVVLAATASLVLAGCGGPAATSGKKKETGGTIPSATSSSLVAAAKKEGSLVWYTSNTRPDAEQIVKEFEQAYPGITVDMFQAGGSQVVSKVEAEAAAGGIKADFVDYSDGAVAVDQANRGLLERFAPEHWDEMPAGLKDADGYWFAPWYLASSIVYNTSIVSSADAPKSWKDLTDAKWKGKVGMASPDYAGTAVSTIAAWSQTFGDDYVTSLGKNGMQVMQGFGDVENAVLSGQTPVAVTLSFRGLTDEAAGKPVKYITPKEGQIQLPVAAAIVAKSAHPNAAKLFANFLMSDTIQKSKASGYYFPARAEFGKDVPDFPDLEKTKFITLDIKKLADPTYVAEVKKLFKDATA